MAFKFRNYSGDEISLLLEKINNGYQAGTGVLLSNTTFSLNQTWLRQRIIEIQQGTIKLVSSLSLSTNSITLTSVNETKTIDYTITPSDATNKTLNWTSSNTSIATVDSSGTVKAISSGSATITAKTTDGTNKSATCSVTVSIPATNVSVSGISVSPKSLTLSDGQQSTISATISPSNATNKGVTWRTSNSDALSLSSQTNTSVKVTAHSSSVDKSVTVTAVSSDGSYSDTVSVTVKKTEPVVETPSILMGTVQYETATPVSDIQTAFDNGVVQLFPYTDIGTPCEEFGGTRKTYNVILIPNSVSEYSNLKGYYVNTLDNTDAMFWDSAEDAPAANAGINGSKTIAYNGVTYRIYFFYNSNRTTSWIFKVKF